MERGIQAEDICIVFRTHQQGRVIKRLLDFKEIKYCSVTKKPLLKDASVKVAVDYLIILDKLKRKERGGEQAWWDLVYLLNFADEDLIKIGKFIRDNRESQCLSEHILLEFAKIDLSDSGKMSAKILMERLELLRESLDKSISDLVRDIFNVAGLIPSGNTKEEKEIILNLNKFYDLTKSHESLYSPDTYSFVL